MSEILPQPSMDDAQISLVRKYHDLMKLYMDERIGNPYNEDETTTNYLHEVISLLSSTIPATRDPEPLMDAVLLVKCFAATVLMSSSRALQVSMFLDWVHTVDRDMTKWSEGLKQRLTSDHKVNKDFWKLVQHYTIIGKFKDAAALLQNSDLSDTADFGYLNELLQSYPTEANKYAVFMHWRGNAVTWFNNLREQPKGEHEWGNEIQNIALILIGDSKTITNNASNWVSAITGLFLFSDPSPEALSVHFATAISAHEVNVIPTWEEGCKDLFEDKTVAALGCLQLLDIGTAVVVSEFCGERNLFEKYSTPTRAGGGVREELALAYISVCLAEPALVDIGCEVLVNVGSSQAKRTAEELLPQLIERSPEYAELAIDAAEQLDLPDLETDLCKIAARSDLSLARYVSAIKFSYRAADYDNVKKTSWDLFREMLVKRQPVGDDYTFSILRDDQTVSSDDLPMTIKDNLSPSAVLLALLEALNAEDVEGILDNLRGLLSFPDPPLEYYPLLVALVSGISGSVLTLKNMAMLMSALELWDSASEAVKADSYELISEASGYPTWEPILGDSPHKLVWLLKRQLAKEVCL